MQTPRFKDRQEAGALLAQKLANHALKDPIIYALPRGGVPVAAAIAAALSASLDLILVRKLGAPIQPELAIGAIVEGPPPLRVLNEGIAARTGASAEYIEWACQQALAEIERRRQCYLGERRRPDPRGRDAIVVDDGIATGATAIAALRALRAQGAAKILLAIPVAPADALSRLRLEADEVVCLLAPLDFASLSDFYLEFPQLEDDEVIRALAAAVLRPDVAG